MTIPTNHKRDPVDWNLIKQRLAAAAAALESEFAPSAAQSQSILRARARALAMGNVEPDVGPEIDVLEFLLGDDGYALEMQYVQEVHPLAELTPLPCTPSFVRGIVNLRGRILSVIDLDPLFGLQRKRLARMHELIVLHHGPMTFAVLADRILGVRRLPLRELQAGPSAPTGIPPDWIMGVTSGRYVVLHAKHLLTDKSIVIDQEAVL